MSTTAVQNPGNVKISLKLRGAGVAELVDAADSKFHFHVQSCSVMPAFSEVFHITLTGKRIQKWHKKWHKGPGGGPTELCEQEADALT